MSSKDNGKDKGSFWATVPGILTGVAGLITALGGLIAVLYNIGVFNPKNGNSSPPQNTSNVNVRPSVEPADCFEKFFSGVARDRVSALEVGAFDAQVAGPGQSKDDVVGIKFTENGRPVGALRFRFFPSSNLFKIEQVVDSRCVEVETHRYRNISRGGEPLVLQSWDGFQVRLGEHEYVLRLGYSSGRITASWQRA